MIEFLFFAGGFACGSFLIGAFLIAGMKRTLNTINGKPFAMMKLLKNIKHLYNHEKSMGSMADYKKLCEFLIDCAETALKEPVKNDADQ